MSGGVDSSVAAHLLQQDGWEVVGVFMRHGSAQPCAVADPNAPTSAALPLIPSTAHGHKQGCCTARDAQDAAQVAARLNIPFYALELSAEFERIVDYFADEYLRGRTPNPCVQCNNWIKFGKLFDYADSIGADYVATGHYARIAADGDVHALYRGLDAAKDQSYVLFGVAPSMLSRMLLPVGEYTKPAIRELAEQLGLQVADKKDSQEICFVAPGKHADFVASRAGPRAEGTITTLDGQVVGTHNGIEHFTIGQRKGLGVALGAPQFVVRIDAEQNRVMIGDAKDLDRSFLTASHANWFDRPRARLRCAAQIRYNSQPQACEVTPTGPREFRVDFDQPCRGIAPGQAVVCYVDDRVIGGGWID